MGGISIFSKQKKEGFFFENFGGKILVK